MDLLIIVNFLRDIIVERLLASRGPYKHAYVVLPEIRVYIQPSYNLDNLNYAVQTLALPKEPNFLFLYISAT